MITVYLPTLKKPNIKSTKYYKDFHNIYYLSQITNLTLESYMDSFIEFNSKAIILNVKKDELLKKGIIKIYKIDGMDAIDILDECAFKSYDLEDLIPHIIEEKIMKRFDDIKNHLPIFGLSIEGENKDIDINIKELLKTTNAKNWYSLIKGFLNIWEFMFLFSNIEMILKQILKNEEIYTENLLEELLKLHPELTEGLSKNSYLDINGNKNLWKIYTQLRHIYSHYHGILTQENKNKLSGKLNNFKKSLNKIDIMQSIFVDKDKLFKSTNMKKDKFYLLPDAELNIFRNFIIDLMETYDEININGLISEK